MPSPSMARSSTPSEWSSNTSPTRICAKRRRRGVRLWLKRFSVQTVLVNCHAYRGIHADFLECRDFALRLDPAGGDDRVRGRGAEAAKPREIGAAHGSFAVHVGA